MKNTVKVRIRTENLPWKGRLKAVEDGSCSGIFKGGFIKKKDNVWIEYNTEGYKSISSSAGKSRDRKTLDYLTVLKLARAIVLNIGRCENKMFFPEQMVLNLDTVYCSADLEDVKFIYIPFKPLESRCASICSVIKQLGRVTDSIGKEYLEIIIGIIKEENFKTETLTAIIDELMAEASVYGMYGKKASR